MNFKIKIKVGVVKQPEITLNHKPQSSEKIVPVIFI